LASIIGGIIVIGGTMMVTLYGLQLQDKAECYKLQRYSKEYAPAFYITKNEKEMCDYLKINVDAPVR
jgi:hypothetical protein